MKAVKGFVKQLKTGNGTSYSPQFLSMFRRAALLYSPGPQSGSTVLVHNPGPVHSSHLALPAVEYFLSSALPVGVYNCTVFPYLCFDL